MKTMKNNLVLGLFLTLVLTITSCSETEDTYNTIVENQTNVELKTTTNLGKILVDANGRSLYFFAKDTKETSNCNNGCLDNWPVFYQENIQTGSGLDMNDFKTITRADGSKQTTYKDWPLYYFRNDANEGDVNGEAVGGVWFVAKPDYSIMYANAQLVGNDGNNYLADYSLGDGTTSYFVSIKGRTMYAFSNDAKNTNNFTKSDLSNNASWPIVEITLDQIPSTLNKSDFGSINVFGKTQLTYKGWPLYYFGGDANRGDNKGVSVPRAGVWPVVNRGIASAQ